MTEEELHKKLKLFNYSKEWLEFGFLTIDELQKQEKELKTGEDINKEHYRGRTFNAFLETRNQLTVLEFENYLKLAEIDEDRLMAGSVIADLYFKVELTDTQFTELGIRLRKFGDWTEKVIKRQTLLREIDTNTFTKELFDKCILNGDAVVQEYIIEFANVEQAEKLIQVGSNKHIRRQAEMKYKKLCK